MKIMPTVSIAIMIAVFFCMADMAKAANSDTLVVYANGPSLDQIINSDTTSAGIQAHSVYKLVTLDTTYLYLGTITPKSKVMTIVGALGSDGRPPCIQPGLLSNGSLPGVFCTLGQIASNLTVNNIYFFGRGPNNGWTGNPLFRVASDSSKISMDNVIIDEVHGTTIVYTGMADVVKVTNCKFRNDVWPSNFTSPGLVAPAYPTSNPVDTCIVNYNTFFCHEASGPAVGRVSKYIEFNHNTVVYNFQYPIGNYAFQYQVNEKIENNIFYGTYAGATTKSRYATTHVIPLAPVGVIEADTLTVADAKVFDPADSSDANFRWLAEAKRTVSVKNNLYFQPKAITDFWTAWNDTASGNDSLITPGFMNPTAQNMFNDKAHWPGFQESGNMIDVDPGFGPSFETVLQSSTTPGIVSLQDFITEVWTGKIKTDEWGYKKQTVSGDNWIPQWPLPEAQDMQYTNAAIKNGSTDGLPLGDPSWFGITTAVKAEPTSVVSKFDLDNNYPNPFNPSTTIKISLIKSGNVSLKIYNMLGQLVKVVDEGFKSSGEYKYNVNMDNFTSGVYFYTLQQGENTMTKKMILLK